MVRVKFAFALLALAQTVFGESPLALEYTCPAQDMDGFGLSCSPDEPCAVFLELSSIESQGPKVFLTGNLHTERTTLYGVVLASEDGGKTWTEPVTRVRAATLEQIQFLDSANGFIGGELIEPLPRDPFFLITADGGKTWQQKAVSDDAPFGSIAQFWFDSKSHGLLILDHSGRRDQYETTTGGQSWELKTPAKASTLTVHKNNGWRLRPDGKSYHIERRGEGAWEPVAAFAIHVADCK
jgi:photosystem II stability/assembly factor-like uncharacterized protein